MTNRHIDFYDSPTMRELARISKEKGFITEAPLMKCASTEEDHFIPSDNLFVDLTRLAGGLRDRGMDRQAERLEGLIVQYKVAEMAVAASMLEDYHPEGSNELCEAEDDLGTVETKDLQQKKDLEVAEKDPTGKWAMAFFSKKADDFQDLTKQQDPAYKAKQKALPELQKEYEGALAAIKVPHEAIARTLGSLYLQPMLTKQSGYAKLYCKFAELDEDKVAKYWEYNSYFGNGGVASIIAYLNRVTAANVAETATFIRGLNADAADQLTQYFTEGEGEGGRGTGENIVRNIGVDALKGLLHSSPIPGTSFVAEEAGAAGDKHQEAKKAGIISTVANEIFKSLSALYGTLFGEDVVKKANLSLKSAVTAMAVPLQQVSVELQKLFDYAGDLEKSFSSALLTATSASSAIQALIKNKDQSLQSIIEAMGGGNVMGYVAAMGSATSSLQQILSKYAGVFNVAQGDLKGLAATLHGYAVQYALYIRNNSLVGTAAKPYELAGNMCLQAEKILSDNAHQPIDTVIPLLSGVNKIFAVKDLKGLQGAVAAIGAYMVQHNISASSKEIMIKEAADPPAAFPSATPAPPVSNGPPLANPLPMGGSANPNLPRQFVGEVAKMQANLAILARLSSNTAEFADLNSVGNKTAPNANDGIWGPNTSRALAAAQKLMNSNNVAGTLEINQHRHDNQSEEFATTNNQLLSQLIAKMGGKAVGGVGSNVVNPMKPLFTIQYKDYQSTVFLRDVANMSGFYDFLKRISNGKAEEMGPDGVLGIRVGTFKEALEIILNQATDRLNGKSHLIESQWDEETNSKRDVAVERDADAATSKNEIDAINECRSGVIKLLNALTPYGTNAAAVITKDQAAGFGAVNDQQHGGAGGGIGGKHQTTGPYQYADYRPGDAGGFNGQPGQHEGKDVQRPAGEDKTPFLFNSIINLGRSEFGNAQRQLNLNVPVLDLRYFNDKATLSQMLFAAAKINVATLKGMALYSMRNEGIVPANAQFQWDPNTNEYQVNVGTGWSWAPQMFGNKYQTAILQQATVSHQGNLQSFLVALPGVLQDAERRWIDGSGPSQDQIVDQQKWLTRWIQAIDDVARQ